VSLCIALINIQMQSNGNMISKPSKGRFVALCVKALLDVYRSISHSPSQFDFSSVFKLDVNDDKVRLG